MFALQVAVVCADCPVVFDFGPDFEFGIANAPAHVEDGLDVRVDMWLQANRDGLGAGRPTFPACPAAPSGAVCRAASASEESVKSERSA